MLCAADCQQQPQLQQQQRQQQQPRCLAAEFAAAVDQALQQEAPKAADWLDVPLGLDDEGSPGMLVLEDGREFRGVSFGCCRAVSGEVVFNTGMVAYPESLTDPSYAGQILSLTFPLIGNYGVPSEETDELGLPLHLEGSRVYVTALLTGDYIPGALAHWNARRQLGEWLKEQQVPALWGIDTRALTKHLRQRGTMLGKVIVLSEEDEAALRQQQASAAAAAAAAALQLRLSEHWAVASVLSAVSSEEEQQSLLQLLQQRAARAAKLQSWVNALEAARDRLPLDDPNARNLVAEVSPKEPKIHVSPINKECRQLRVLAVDCGMKANIYRQFLYTNFEGCNILLKAVPWDYDYLSEEYDGLFLSNGPGDPVTCTKTIQHLTQALKQQRPIFGICLGNQLLALAAGAKTYRMKFGNRGMNQPVIDLRTTRCYITAQNHGFAVDTDTLPPDFIPLFVNANDKTNEGLSHRVLPYFSAQFHPEAAGGPTDTFFLFGEFIDTLKRQQQHLLRRYLYTIPYQFPRLYRKVLLLGSGGLSIGQAGEFDYSGSQAIKALTEHNVYVVVINPNIATVQTSKHMAQRVYFVPVTPKFVTEVLEKERPQGILCAFGGQTALNCVVELARTGVLKKYDCQVLGTPIEAIVATEDREVFAAKLREVGEQVAPSAAAASLEEAVAAAAQIGYPVLIRAAFALGGLGSGFAENEASLRRLCKEAFAHSTQVFIDRSLKGWKEVEFEIVRDAKGNCVAVCNMENLDPLGIHTGDSIVIAPSQTLSNQDYYRLRECALKVIRHLGIVGECNIQYALDPHSEQYYIVEVNARLSRSSALASKASGYPLAYIAAKLALGHDLLTLCNDVTKETTACFEPAFDYVVTKVPRWDMKKFNEADPYMGSAMKSVGEVMAIGRTFEESLQKALSRMVNGEANGFDENMCPHLAPREGEELKTARARLEQELAQPSAARIWGLAEALRQGYSVETLHRLTRIDPWFLCKLQHIQQLKEKLQDLCLAQLTKADLIYVKKYGFSDRQIAAYVKAHPLGAPTGGESAFCASGGGENVDREDGVACRRSPRLSEDEVWRYRQSLSVLPKIKQIDTVAAEFPAHTNYLYLTYQATEDDVRPLTATQHQTSESWVGRGVNQTPTAQNGPCPTTQETLSSQGSPLPPSLSSDVSPLIKPKPGSILSRLCSSYGLTRAQMEEGRSPGCYVVLGCGCYCIGSSVEFDWSAVSCINTLRSLGHRAIVVNCNPETVSTDYDVSDRLYFEDLTLETVANIWTLEKPRGVIISVGGQTPNNLCNPLEARGVVIRGTRASAIDCCEDRHKFSKLCDELRLDQPAWSEFRSLKAAQTFCKKARATQSAGCSCSSSCYSCCHVGYPVLVRPSYVLSGAAMRVVTSEQQLQGFLQDAAVVSGDSPVVISKFVENAKEVEFDSVANHGEILNYAISEHVENAGTHSGDATLILPAQKLYVETIRQGIYGWVGVCLLVGFVFPGPFNIQFICKNNEVKVIECNLRASRTFPFISKTFGVDFIEQATKVMVGAPVAAVSIHLMDLEFVCVKAPVFSFSRLRGCDPVLGVEMRSTGEVACFGTDKHEAFLKALLSTGLQLPLKKRTIMLTTGPLWSKVEFYPFAIKLIKLGFTIYATKGTYEFLRGGLGRLQCEGVDGEELESDEPWGHLPSRPVEDTDDCSSSSSSSSGSPGHACSNGLHPLDLEKHLVHVSKERQARDQAASEATEVIVTGEVELVINVPGRTNTNAVTMGYLIRRAAIDAGVPLITDLKVASLFVESLAKKFARENQKKRFWEVRAWDEYQP
ncbi:hypothetical protein Esti_004187 [Eimeria stiedai]